MADKIEVGDVVTRILAGEIPVKLKVTDIKDGRVICGAWEFDAKTGAEIDDDLGWGPPPKRTGSFLVMSVVRSVRVDGTN